MGGYITLTAYKQGLQLNLELKTKEPEQIDIKPKPAKIDITNLFGTRTQDVEMPPADTNRTELIDEWLNGPKESR
jgi:hypothetical protein